MSICRQCKKQFKPRPGRWDDPEVCPSCAHGYPRDEGQEILMVSPKTSSSSSRVRSADSSTSSTQLVLLTD